MGDGTDNLSHQVGKVSCPRDWRCATAGRGVDFAGEGESRWKTLVIVDMPAVAIPENPGGGDPGNGARRQVRWAVPDLRSGCRASASMTLRRLRVERRAAEVNQKVPGR
jgi:hypothetical protein